MLQMKIFGPVVSIMSIVVVALLMAASVQGCRPQPPNLTPQASAAFKATEVVRVLDVLRDVAIDANEQAPPLMSTDATRRVVLYHQSTVKLIQAVPDGYRAVAEQGLEELMANLPPPDRDRLAPYVDLLKVVMREVLR